MTSALVLAAVGITAIGLTMGSVQGTPGMRGGRNRKDQGNVISRNGRLPETVFRADEMPKLVQRAEFNSIDQDDVNALKSLYGSRTVKQNQQSYLESHMYEKSIWNRLAYDSRINGCLGVRFRAHRAFDAALESADPANIAFWATVAKRA